MKKTCVALSAFIVLSLGGCATSPSQQIKDKYYSQWSPKMQAAVDAKEVLVGMDRNQVQAATGFAGGSLNLINKMNIQTVMGTIETWTLYKDSMFGWSWVQGGKMVQIQFTNGIVTSVATF